MYAIEDKLLVSMILFMDKVDKSIDTCLHCSARMYAWKRQHHSDCKFVAMKNKLVAAMGPGAKYPTEEAVDVGIKLARQG